MRPSPHPTSPCSKHGRRYRKSTVRRIEVAWLGSARVGVRDSTNQYGPALIVRVLAWDAFIDAVQSNMFDCSDG
ncbi:DUF397 domain-containing protein [Nocardia sp. NPDC058058]|uniref:DUF397 domain-containing protein n=1 Tax=Nocardia sp. NPDC058058 TaxID=3346317 RepID=UPI0036DA7095